MPMMEPTPQIPAPLLVIGAPRSGFTLLISVLTEIRARSGDHATSRQALLRLVEADLGHVVADRIVGVFEQAGLGDRLLFNDNFRRLVGGPRWIDAEDPSRICFRKYIGAPGLGDFTLVTRHPAALLEVDRIVHSHSGAAAWPELPAFAGHRRFASLRHPFGVLNSSVFSINALTSEYIQRFVAPEDDNDLIRQRLAEYKLTDRNFFASLVRHLSREMAEYLPHRERYVEMAWEDLIRTPEATITRLGAAMEAPLPEAAAAEIWRGLAYRNLTGAHRHNFRPGHGRIGGWKETLVNEHLEIACEGGLDPIARALGWDPGERLDPAAYSPFQRRIAEALKQGKVIDDTTDRDLFIFAFNKTNIDFSRFGFRVGAWRTHTRLERSCFQEEALERRVSDAAEEACGALNAFLEEFLALRTEDGDRAARALFTRHERGLGRLTPERYARTRQAVLDALGDRPRRSLWRLGAAFLTRRSNGVASRPRS
jgi:hypothetical protein